MLAYRFGTHSGWVEICYDAGVRVVTPDCGHFSEQKSVRVYRLMNMRPDRASLLAAVGTAIAAAHADDGAEDPRRRQLRARQRRRVRLEHADIYRRWVSSKRKHCAQVNYISDKLIGACLSSVRVVAVLPSAARSLSRRPPRSSSGDSKGRTGLCRFV